MQQIVDESDDKMISSNCIFQGLKSRKIEFNFDGGDISRDGGLLFFKEFDRKLGLTQRTGKCLSAFDVRQSEKVKHSFPDMLRQRVFGLVAGNEDLNDHHELRNNPLIQTVVGRDRQLATPSTLCRFENGIARQACVELSRLFVEFFVESFAAPPRELILDFDATDDLTYGMQEKRFFHGYYDHYCFLPLYVFCGDQLLAAYLRPSKIDAAKHTRAILSLLVKHFRQKWPNVRIVFRGDSGFCRQKMLNWCDKNNVKYIVGLAKNSRLLKLSKELQDQAETSYEKTHEKVKLFTEFEYAAGTWKYARRVIAKAEFNSLGPNNRFIVTNLDEDGQYLYEKVYCARGEMENRIKEQQLDLFADRTSCHDFVANQFRLLLSSLAYILMERFRTLLLNGTKFAQATCGSIRLYLVKIGAVIRRNTRKIYVALSSACPNQELLRLTAAKIIALE